MSCNIANDQKCREVIIDEMQRGLISPSEANVRMVRNERFRVVYKLSRDVRKALNDAVKSGELAHMKKDGLKPEVYYHPAFKHLADDARTFAFNRGVNALKSVCVA